MKKTLLVLVSAIILFSMNSSAAGTEYYSYSYARLSYVNGDVFIQRVDDLGYEEGVVNLVLVQGDKIGIREGRAELHLGRKNYLRIDRQTQLDLIELPQQNSDRIQLHLLAGDIFLRVSFLAKEKDIEIHTPDASFYVLEEGLYRLSVREERQTELCVFEGQIEAAGEEGSLVVGDNERLIALEGFFSSESQYDSAYDDSFALWNTSRDELLTRYVARQYLPAELYEYEIELAYAGRWVYESPYGYVWVPYGVRTGWRPYHYGRWVWYPIIGWTWISHDPWGWAVYRYGRWHWRASLGWYWIPTSVWGPAWVHWHSGFDTIGWCPLSLWNRPVVIVNNVFYGQYNDAYYPVQSKALTVIHKNQLQAASISAVALAQDRVAQMGRISLSPRQPDLRPVVDNNSASSRLASQVLSRTRVRGIQRNFSADRPVSSGSGIETRPGSGGSSRAAGSGVIRRSGEEVRTSLSGSRPDQPSRTVRTFGSALSRESADRTSASGRTDVSAQSRSVLGTKKTAAGQGEAPRSIIRYGSSVPRATLENRSASSGSATPPAGERSSSQGIKNSPARSRPTAPSSSRLSSSAGSQSAAESARSRALEKRAVKQYAPSAASSLSRNPAPLDQNRSTQRTSPQNDRSSSTPTIQRSRSTSGLPRYPTSKSLPSQIRSSSVVRPPSSSASTPSSRSTSRTSTPSVGRATSSSSSRNSSVRTPTSSSSRSKLTPVRQPSPTRVSSSRSTSSASTPSIGRATSSSSSRSSSVRTPTRSSSRSSLSSSSSASRSRSSSSSGRSVTSRSQTASSSSAGRRVKK